MTPQEKKDRRIARHEVEARVKRLVRRRIGLYSTKGQIKAALKEFVDGYMKNMSEMTRTARVLEGAQEVNGRRT